MSDTGTPAAGVETPSRFMMGLEGDDDNDRFEKAVESAFGNRPQDDGQEGGQDENRGQGQETQEGAAPEGEAASDPNVAGQASQGDEGIGEGQGPAGDGSPAGTSSETDTDPLALFEFHYGRKPTGAEMQGLLALADWANSLTPEQQEAINNALYAQPQTQAQEPTPPTPDPLEEEIGDDPILRAIYERQQRTEAELQKIAQANVADQHARVIKGLEDGATRFKEQYNVTDAELTGLQSALGSARLLPGFVSAYQDPAEAMYRGLDYLYWNTPTFRDREIQKQIESRQAQEQNHQERKRRASSVTGTGGNGASRTAPPPTTPDGHWAAVADGIRDAMNNGQG